MIELWTGPTVALAASWLLTFGLQSTLAIVIAWFVARRLGSLAGRDIVWKTALVIPLVTSTVQIGFAVQPLTGSFNIMRGADQNVPAVPALETHLQRGLTAVGTGLTDLPELDRDAGPAAVVNRDPVPLGSIVAGAVPAATKSGAAGGIVRRLGKAAGVVGWAGGLLVVWAIAAVIGLVRFGVARRRLAAWLESRRAVEDPMLLAQIDTLRRNARIRGAVRLTWSPVVSVPVAFRREICLPQAALSRLDEPHLLGILAHEMAHVARRDSWWLQGSLLMERVFPFQPLYRLLRRELQAVAEYLCDDWAVAQTGRSLAIAESLAEVAAWLSGARRPLALPSLAGQASQLVRRVERILDGESMLNSDIGSSHRFVRGATVFVATVAMSVTAPGVTLGAAQQEPPKTARPPVPVVALAPMIERAEHAVPVAVSVLPEPMPPSVVELGGVSMAPVPMSSMPDHGIDLRAPSAPVAPPSRWEAPLGDAAAVPAARVEWNGPVPPSTIARQDTVNPRVVASLSRALSDSIPEVRKEAVEALGRLEARAAVPALIPLLDDADEDVRRTVVWALAQMKDQRAADGLIAALRDPSGGVRKNAAEAVGELGVRRAAPGLIALMNDPDPEIRRVAIAQLWALRDTSAVGAIARRVADSSAAVRRTAVSALGRFRQSESYPVIAGALDDAVVAVRKEAIAALARLGDRRAVRAYTMALADDSPEVRQAAVAALGSVDDSTVVPVVIAALGDPAAAVRLAAVGALREYDDIRSMGPLSDLLADPVDEVRAAAARGLGELADPAVIPALARVARGDSVAAIRRSAIGGLARFYRPGVVDPLIDALTDSDEEVRQTAARAIGQLAEYHGGRAAQEHAARAQMVAAVPRMLTGLIGAMDDPDSKVRENTARALGYLGDGRAVDPLIVALRDGASDVRKEAVFALGRINDDRAIEPLIAVLDDADSDVRRAAVRTLGRFPNR